MKKLMLMILLPINLFAARFEISSHEVQEKFIYVSIDDNQFHKRYFYKLPEYEFFFKETTFISFDVSDVMFWFLPFNCEDIPHGKK